MDTRLAENTTCFSCTTTIALNQYEGLVHESPNSLPSWDKVEPVDYTGSGVPQGDYGPVTDSANGLITHLGHWLPSPLTSPLALSPSPPKYAACVQILSSGCASGGTQTKTGSHLSLFRYSELTPVVAPSRNMGRKSS